MKISKYLEIPLKTTNNKLTTIEKPYKKPNSYLYYVKCKCDCGKVKVVGARCFLRGKVKSCGCLMKGNIKHGLTNNENESCLYAMWKSIRCNNTLCKEWDNPKIFIEWIKESNWEKGLYPTRKDYTKVLGPDNIEFLTTEQKKEKTRIFNGNTVLHQGKTPKEWAKKVDKCLSGFNKQVREQGWEYAIKSPKYKSALPLTITDWLDSIEVDYVCEHYIKPMRPDILIPSSSLIIECDGLYWHNDLMLDKKGTDPKNYHKNKRDHYIKHGYTPLFFREDELNHKLDVVKSIVGNKLGLSNKIYARKCEIVEVNLKDRKVFFKENHLMSNGSGKCYGLTYKDELVCGMQFINKSKHVEVSRFCCKLNTVVVGGLSRLLKILPKKPIVSFVDLRYGDGKSLLGLGFEKKTEHVSFKWTDLKQTYHRMKFKSNSGYDLGLSKIWDCGQAKYIAE